MSYQDLDWNYYGVDESDIRQDNGWIHQDDLKHLTRVKELVEWLVEEVYENGNVENIEKVTEELADYFEVKFTNRKPVIAKV